MSEREGNTQAQKTINLYHEAEKKANKKSAPKKNNTALKEFSDAVAIFCTIVNIFTGRSKAEPYSPYDSDEPDTYSSGNVRTRVKEHVRARQAKRGTSSTSSSGNPRTRIRGRMEQRAAKRALGIKPKKVKHEPGTGSWCLKCSGSGVCHNCWGEGKISGYTCKRCVGTGECWWCDGLGESW